MPILAFIGERELHMANIKNDARKAAEDTVDKAVSESRTMKSLPGKTRCRLQ